ncbi:MBL fold metallo-hydrolase, partial [Candidatus Micrarchaeota archaeon CG_4_10_14_0_2_um_filter_49_7]
FLKKEPALVILTHNHFDHSQGVKEGWNVYLHEKDLEERKFAHVPKNAKRIDFESIRFHEFEFEIHNTPGHTPGSIVLLEKKTKILFSGDTLFAGGYPGRTDLEGGNERDMENSLKFIEKLDYGLLCPGHDEIEKRE